MRDVNFFASRSFFHVIIKNIFFIVNAYSWCLFPALISVWWSIDKRYEFLKFLRTFWRVRVAQDFLLSFLALRSESAADRCDFSFRHGGRGNETGSKPVEGKRRERDLLATRGEPDFAFGEHRRRPSREKPVIGGESGGEACHPHADRRTKKANY